MMWRDRLTPQELREVDSAPAGALIRKLADLLDQMQSRTRPERPALQQYDHPGAYIPPNIIRLDE